MPLILLPCNKMSPADNPTTASKRDQAHASALSRAASGRSGRRSRTGCIVCKQRRVRCDEARPVCGHCSRLQLECDYQIRPRKKARVASISREVADSNDYSGEASFHEIASSLTAADHLDTDGKSLNNDNGVENQQQQSKTGALDSLWATNGRICDRAISHDVQRQSADRAKTRCQLDGSDQRQDLNAGPSKGVPFSFPSTNVDFFDFAAVGTFDAPNPENSFGTFMFDDTPWHSPPRPNNNVANGSHRPVACGKSPEPSAQSMPTGFVQNTYGCQPLQGIRPLNNRCQSDIAYSCQGAGSVVATNCDIGNEHYQYLLSYFRRIVQPAAAILVGGVHKWRRLQRYLVRISEQSRAVANALFALIELLATDETNSSQRGSMAQALEWHESARKEIDFEISRAEDIESKTKDKLLAAVFLLAWFEVIRDQVTDDSLFPIELADRIILSKTDWNAYSKQLLQWLNTLDCKATHLGGHHLLSPEALQVVSQHLTQISTTDGSDDENADHGSPEQLANASSIGRNSLSPIQISHPLHHSLSPECSQPNTSTLPSLGQLKQILLNTILQPALEWYLTSQSYCRRISSLDRHHRNRFTVNDEYEVVTAYKQLETDLFKLWRQRPMCITLTATQLSEVVCMDVAVRLEEIFSIYLASFWILFVFLHRVIWYALPHSETTRGALNEAFKNMQRSYGEIGNGGNKKVVHPALMWPLFLFGSECRIDVQRNWAIEQLEALGEAKPVIGEDNADDVLPPFRLSAGATRNSKRAALLLRELVKRQDESSSRVDEKDLSVELFGCHFSII